MCRCTSKSLLSQFCSLQICDTVFVDKVLPAAIKDIFLSFLDFADQRLGSFETGSLKRHFNSYLYPVAKVSELKFEAGKKRQIDWHNYGQNDNSDDFGLML